MNPVRWFLILVLAVAMIPAARASFEPADPTRVVRELYEVDIKHNGFDQDTVKAERDYLAPDLYTRILKDLKRELKEEGLVDEDLILGAQDIPTKYTVGEGTMEHDTAKVPVDLAWDADKLHYIVSLKKFGGAWKVTEIDYGKDGKLTDLLK